MVNVTYTTSIAVGASTQSEGSAWRAKFSEKQSRDQSNVVIVINGARIDDSAWFWSDAWQAGEREADEDIAAGRVTRYNSSEDFLASL